MRRRFVTNSLSGAIQTIVCTLLVFITIPVFIRLLGTERYGVFSLIMVIGSLNGIVNLGLNKTLIKFIAEQGKVTESNYDIVVNLILLLFGLVPITIAGIVFHEFVLSEILGISLDPMGDVKWLYFFVLVSNLLLIFGQTFSAILEALQKIYVTNICQMIYNFAYWGLILFVLLLGFQVDIVGAMALVAATIWLAAIVMAAHKAWGPILIGDLRKNFGRVAKKQLRYVMQIYVGGLVSFFYEPFTKILLSHFIGIQSVAFFDIALKIRNQVWGFVSKILQPLYPLLSQLSDRVRLRMIIHDLEQKTFLLIIPALPIIVFCTRPLISLWMRENVGIITVSVIFILSAYVLAITVIPNYQFLLAKGHAEKTIVIQGSNVVFNALFFFLTYRWIGYYAVIVGNIAAILSSYALTLYYQKKYLDSLIFESFAQARKVFLTLGIDLLVAYATSSLLDSNMATLLSVPVAVIVSTVLMYRYFGLITATDIQRYSGSNDTLNHWGLKILCRT